MFPYFLLTILLLGAINCNCQKFCNFTKKDIDKNVGLYYEPMHQIRFTKAEWRLVTFIDIKKFEAQKPFVSDSVIRSLQAACYPHLAPERCDGLINRDYIKAKFVLAEKYVQQIHSFINMENKSSMNADVIKRSVPFGFIGSISKSLFGTMDADDARYFNGEIDKLYKDQKQITHVIEKQAHLVKSGFHYFHEEIEKLNNRTKETQNSLTKLMRALQHHVSLNNHLSIILQIEEVMRQQEIEIDNYVNNLEMILEAVYFAKLGFIHPAIITVETLEKSVKHFIQNNDNKERVFPISLEEVKSGGLGKISRTAIGYDAGRLFFVMHVPLVDPRVFNLYKMHPYPIAQTYGENKRGAAYIQPRTDYLIISKEQDRYSLIHETDLPHCQATTHYHICSPSYPLYEVSMQPICEISLITKRKNHPLDDCNIRMSKKFNPHWKQLHNGKGWLYSVPEKEEIHIICEASRKESVNISGAGILSLKPGCHANTVYALFMGYQVINEATTYEFKPVTRLNVTAIFPEIVNYEPLREPYPQTDIPRVTSSANVPGVLSYDVTLDEIQREMKEIGEHKREQQQQEKITFWTIVGEICLASSFLCFLLRSPSVWIFWKIWECCGCSKSKIEEPSVSFHLKKDEPMVNIHLKKNKKVDNDGPVYATPSNVVF